MRTRGPTLGQVAIAVAFAFSCFGLLLFLWSTFGGPIPLKPEGYRVKVPFDEATQLAVEADVRVSNVPVGKVKRIELGEEGQERDYAVATIEVEDSYAPIPEDTRAVLRAKTLLGETYVELTQGSGEAQSLPEGGTLPPAQVGESVQLDEIFRTFDRRTRDAFRTWMQEAALATSGRGADLSAAIANLEPFAEGANRLLRVLDSQQGAVRQFVNDTGVVFEALTERQGQLRSLIRNSGTVFATTARRNEDLREAFIALPTFLDESRLTLNRLERFAADTDPLIDQLHPAARELTGVFRQTGRVAPDFRGFFVGFRKLAKRSGRAFPALRALLDTDLPPLLGEFSVWLRQVTPLVATLERYKGELTGLLGNVAAATNAQESKPEAGGTQIHYLRTAGTLHPEAFAFFPNRLTTNRSNPYLAAGAALSVSGGMPSFPIDSPCGSDPDRDVADLPETIATDPVFEERFAPEDPDGAQDLFDRISHFAFDDNVGDDASVVPAPPCYNQAPQTSIGVPLEGTNYLHANPYP